MLRREGFVTVKEAAELLDVALNSIRAWGAAGKITEYRHPVNNYRMYKRKELEKLLDEVHRGVNVAGTTKRRGQGRSAREFRWAAMV